MSCTAMTDFEKVRVTPEYKEWFLLVMKMFNRVANEKGAERHGKEGVPFEKQMWAKIFKNKRAGLGWAYGQIMKKDDEAHGFIDRGEISKAIPEFLDCAVAYLMIAMYYEKKVLDIWEKDTGDKGFTIVDKPHPNDVLNVRTLDE